MLRGMMGLVLSAMIAGSAGIAQAQQALPVQVVTAKITAQSREFRLTGTVQATDTYPAGFRDGGRVISVSVDVGDTVRKGQEIARVDPAQAEAALRQAKASLDAAQASLVQAQQARDRAEGLLKRGSGTQADVDSATEDYLTAKGSRDQASAQLAAARRTQEDTVLTAVEDAIVTERDAEPGQVVAAGTTIVELAGMKGREAVFLTPDMDELDKALGQKVTITPVPVTGKDAERARGMSPVTATVSEISPVVADNGTVKTKARIPEEDAGHFTIGEPVEGALQLSLPSEIAVPWSALTSTAKGPAVFIVNPADQTVSLRQVTIGSFTTDKVRVASGLKEGDLVVGGGSQLLFPGRKVTYTQEASQ